MGGCVWIEWKSKWSTIAYINSMGILESEIFEGSIEWIQQINKWIRIGITGIWERSIHYIWTIHEMEIIKLIGICRIKELRSILIINISS